ncbi:uncharacterized protein SPPG_01387 [Spizellomyces punctatus DAOM BR117]|uniref:PPM-type phosphatase domain-containing protein n=1 Tax=Spizellomyces punctatus (strain DAOM BR117) TaxID=645134 RepID=A0A0L0HS76_SPIPD|nr:uncharacterized protein SPPG_01387 [Spizellomyces punctatus DAOM BR117]KND03937.1 hypothetical protein SPPG_01387 [Spizellomyces punctatus DAOM BR117]|eukprot:XP_016611976.1 hypothetical protein SPPG_01387 [Spizellomyces punctatus DAOM BR117]
MLGRFHFRFATLLLRRLPSLPHSHSPYHRFSTNFSRDLTKKAPHHVQGPPFRIHVNESPGTVGVVSVRGDRETNEDRATCEVLRVNLPDDDESGTDLYWFAVFDGHGGTSCSSHIHQHLHRYFESVRSKDLSPTLTALSKYFERPISRPAEDWSDPLTLEQRMYLSFLKAEVDFFQSNRDVDTVGSTASVVVVKIIELGGPSTLDVVVGHVGDSRILLCTGSQGVAEALTVNHHPSEPDERARIESLGGFTTHVPDAPHSELVLGGLAVSRCFGDLKYKRYGGVTVEPQVQRRRIQDDDQAAFLCLVTDGISGVSRDQEIVDLIKKSDNPPKAASAVIQFSESLGSSDNKTCVVVRLPGWSSNLPDLTRKERDARIKAHANRRRNFDCSDPDEPDVEAGAELNRERLKAILSDVFGARSLRGEDLFKAFEERGVRLDMGVGQEGEDKATKEEPNDVTLEVVQKLYKVLDKEEFEPIDKAEAQRGLELLGVYVRRIDPAE